MQYYLDIVVRLVLACLLGGIIGFEREHGNRPAGFRTHILVCVGSALAMVTSEYIFNVFSSRVSLDPARLGAQVISGIGFLGAGTIVRKGFNVKGLTTAASLWAVACVGLAAGIGFYEGAVIATILIYITLMLLKKLEKKISIRKQYMSIIVEAANTPEIVYELTDVFSRYDVLIRNIEQFNRDNAGGDILVKFFIKPPMHSAWKTLSRICAKSRVYGRYTRNKSIIISVYYGFFFIFPMTGNRDDCGRSQ